MLNRLSLSKVHVADVLPPWWKLITHVCQKFLLVAFSRCTVVVIGIKYPNIQRFLFQGEESECLPPLVCLFNLFSLFRKRRKKIMCVVCCVCNNKTRKGIHKDLTPQNTFFRVKWTLHKSVLLWFISYLIYAMGKFLGKVNLLSKLKNIISPHLILYYPFVLNILMNLISSRLNKKVFRQVILFDQNECNKKYLPGILIIQVTIQRIEDMNRCYL